MNMTNLAEMKELDEEWIDLILTARKLGLSVDEIRAFLIDTSQGISSHKAPPCNDAKGDGPFGYEYA